MTSKQAPNSFTAVILVLSSEVKPIHKLYPLQQVHKRARHFYRAVNFVCLKTHFARGDFYISLKLIFHLIYLSDIFRVFCADHTYTTLALPYKATAQTIVNTAEERVLLGNDCVLCEVKSSGGLFYIKRFLYAFTWKWPICLHFSFLRFISILNILGQNGTSISETICPTVLGFCK